MTIDRIHEEFEDTKGVIRIRKSKKDKQHNDPKEKGQKERQRSTKHYIENHRKDRATRTPLKMVTVRKSDSPR